MGKQASIKEIIEEPYQLGDVYDTFLGPSSDEDDDTQWIAIEQIVPASNQPRQYFDQKKLEELAQSFDAQGFQGAINVRSKDGKYEIVAGERRYRAARLARLDQVRCVITDFSDEDAFEFAMRENLNRENLSKLEEVEGILHLIELRHNIPRKAIIELVQSAGNRMSRSEKNVLLNSETNKIIDILKRFGIELSTFRTTYLPLLNLPEELREAHLSGVLGYNHVLEINKVKDSKQRQLLLKEAIDRKLSVRKIKEQIKALNQPPARKNSITKMGPPKPVKTLWTQLAKSSIWSDTQKVEKLLAAMQDALDIEPHTA
ncbi:ParB-like partition protein [Leptolyngbya sp. PCC 7375]|nr:ParB-like partition protein [Leptolyngbya sp. PCC 7375]